MKVFTLEGTNINEIVRKINVHLEMGNGITHLDISHDESKFMAYEAIIKGTRVKEEIKDLSDFLAYTNLTRNQFATIMGIYRTTVDALIHKNIEQSKKCVYAAKMSKKFDISVERAMKLLD